VQDILPLADGFTHPREEAEFYSPDEMEGNPQQIHCVLCLACTRAVHKSHFSFRRQLERKLHTGVPKRQTQDELLGFSPGSDPAVLDVKKDPAAGGGVGGAQSQSSKSMFTDVVRHVFVLLEPCLKVSLFLRLLVGVFSYLMVDFKSQVINVGLNVFQHVSGIMSVFDEMTMLHEFEGELVLQDFEILASFEMESYFHRQHGNDTKANFLEFLAIDRERDIEVV
jgi:hypothetical protein